MKRLLILVLAILLCLAFVGCNKRTSDGLDEFEQLLNEEESESEVAFAERVYMIIPQNCSAELSAKALEIAGKITEKTGVPVSVKYDNESTVSQGNNLEILVGSTNKLHSKEVLESLKVGEYVCCWDRGVIIIGGRYEESTLEALDEFAEKVLPGASYASLMGENVNLKKTVEYEIGSITLNGYDLYDFTIMYRAENENREKDIALVLRDYLAKQSGYMLDVISADERNNTTGKVIAVGNAFGENESWEKYNAVVKTLEGNDILVNGNGSYGVSAAAAEFINKISSSVKDKNGNATFPSPITVDAKNAQVKICNAFVSDAQTNEQLHDFVQNMRDGQFDIVIFSSISEDTVRSISHNKQSYVEYTLKLKDGNVFCALYDTDTVKDVKYEADCVSFRALEDGKFYRVCLNSDAQKVTEYAFDMMVIDTPVSEASKSIDGFALAGEKNFSLDGESFKKSFYVAENFASDGGFEVKGDTTSEWSNIFCSVTLHTLFCDEYISLKNAVR